MYFEKDIHDCKEGNGSQLTFGQYVQKSKLSFCGNFKRFTTHFSLFSWYFFAFTAFSIFSCLQDDKGQL